MDLREISKKWDDLEWTRGQLENHLFEVGHLSRKGDPHLVNELADLSLICQQMLILLAERSGENSSRIEEERLLKFVVKARGD